MESRTRCFWAGDDPLYVAYHDEEWGEPIRDDRLLFEFLILEGFQAGLSWRTILYKRDNFRRAFDNFDAALIASYDEARIRSLLQDPGIVRNHLKIRGAVRNAQACLRVATREGSFGRWIWGFVGGEALLPQQPLAFDKIPAKTPIAEAMSKALLKEGFAFVGPTICYAFMQATGLVNDHHIGCFKYAGPPPEISAS